MLKGGKSRSHEGVELRSEVRLAFLLLPSHLTCMIEDRSAPGVVEESRPATVDQCHPTIRPGEGMLQPIALGGEGKGRDCYCVMTFVAYVSCDKCIKYWPTVKALRVITVWNFSLICRRVKRLKAEL